MKFPKGIVKTKQPKMTPVRGRAWNSCPVVLSDGTEVKGWYDVTWGTNFYFAHDGVWYRGPIYDFDTGKSRHVITIDLREKAA